MTAGKDAPDRASALQRTGAIVTAFIVVPALLLLVVYCFRSVGWRTEHDVPLAHYSAFMHAQYGTKPYAELFEISFPGTILVHLAVTRVFGYGDRGVMIANLLWFLPFCGVTGALMARFGRVVAVASVALFGVTYFSHGRDMMLQRDCLLILPVAAAILLSDRKLGTLRVRRFAIGFLIGTAAALKPHAAIALAPLLVSDLGSGDATPRRARVWQMATASAWYALGLAVPCSLVFAWLVSSGGFTAWLEMSRDYLPLYLHMTGYHQTIEGAARLRYLLEGALAIGDQFAWIPAATAGVLVMRLGASTSAPRLRLTRLLLGEAVVFAIYPVLAGQFWSYHYVPFEYFLVLLSSLCLTVIPEARTATQIILPKVALIVALLFNSQISESVRSLGSTTPVKRGEVDEMAQFLTARLRPGDTVQPLDWTGGAVHAMLIARAPLATRFMYDYHFYHHVSRPFIQVLRVRFMTDMRRSQPRFVIEYFGDKKPWPRGKDTTREFPELKEFLAAGYVVEASAANYRIYERRPSAAPAAN